MPSQSNLIAQEEEIFLVRIAWACEIEGLTQAQAASCFGVTRLRVNKALAEARNRGIVQVTINSNYLPCAKAESDLKEKFQLSDAHVAPVAEKTDNVQQLIGNTLGHYLNKLLANPATGRFGMSWGSTLNYAMQSMMPLNRPELEIVSVMGCATHNSDLNIIESTRLLANLCGAQKSYLTAPLYASSAKSCKILMEQPVISEMIENIRTVDSLAMTLGDTSALSNTVRDALPKTVRIEDLVERGAVGDALGYYLDKNGKPVQHQINRCVLGIQLHDLQHIPNVILAAGGGHKIAVLRAFLKRRLTNTLITDQHTAAALLTE